MDHNWAQVLTIIGGNAAIFIPLFFWLRSESNADRRDLVNLIFDLEKRKQDKGGSHGS